MTASAEVVRVGEGVVVLELEDGELVDEAVDVRADSLHLLPSLAGEWCAAMK